MDYNLFEEVLKGLCYYDPTSDDAPSGTASKDCRNSNSDIPGGFQDIPPQLFVLIGEVLGNAIAGKLPFNIQNSLGNWLELVGQVILTVNAQQQYSMNGPGKFYNPIYRNSGNPFCPSSGNAPSNVGDGGANNTEETSKSGDKVKEKREKREEDVASMNDLNIQINELRYEIELLKKEISNLKGNG